MYNILFICTGNTCRSPIAAALAKDILKKEGIEAVVDSAGVSVPCPLPATGHTVSILKEYGLDLSGHMSREFTSGDLEKADIILTMTKQHKDYLLSREHRYSHKIFSLGEYAGENQTEVVDPYGGDISMYKSCAGQIEALIRKIARVLYKKLNS